MINSCLNPQYRFDNFDVKENNKFAYKAAQIVVESSDITFNPLFIHGKSGVGKSHLMNAIGNYILAKCPTQTVLYTRGGDFITETVDALKSEAGVRLDRFREKYNNVDVLLVDDFQIIVGKECVWEEFFCIFKQRCAKNKQIVLGADKRPREFDTLTGYYCSLLESGLITEIKSNSTK